MSKSNEDFADGDVQRGPTLKDRFYEYGQRTTGHGVRYIMDYNLHTVRRLVWFVLVAFMNSYLIYGVCTSVLIFMDRPVTSVVKVNYVQSIPFPAVTFCNYNQWKSSRVPPAFYDAVRSLDPIDTGPINITYLRLFDHANVTAALLNSTHSISDMLRVCKFKNEPCSAADFKQIVTDLGVCYTFNDDPDNIKYVHQSGSHNALFLQIDIQQYEYIFGDDNAAGLKLLVHPQGEHPLVKELGIAIQPGHETLVGLHLRQVLSLGAPYESNCTNGFLKFSDDYSVPLCQYEQRIATIASACGCRDMRSPGPEKECPLSNYSGCLIPSEGALTAADKSFDCPVPCNLTVYEPQLSFAHYPGQHHLEEMMAGTNFTETEIRNNILNLRIYFKELSFTRIEEIPSYTLFSLQSSIGGYMGLLIGASLITVFEFLDFILITVTAYLPWNREHEGSRLKKKNKGTVVATGEEA